MAEEFFTWLQREKRLELSAQQRQAVLRAQGGVRQAGEQCAAKLSAIADD